MENFRRFLQEVLAVSYDDAIYANKVAARYVNKGEFLLNAGQVCSDTFFVEKGLLRMYSVDESGKEHIIQFAPENWLISDRSSQYFKEKSAFSIEAVEPSEVLVLPYHFFSDLAEVNPASTSYNMDLMLRHVRSLQSRINGLLGATAEERYLDFIKTYPDVFRRVPQHMVASYLGITPESLSRVRKELVKNQR